MEDCNQTSELMWRPLTGGKPPRVHTVDLLSTLTTNQPYPHSNVSHRLIHALGRYPWPRPVA
eukprot:1042543-Amorphochlora_amoeboformis.AAC.1